MRSINPFLFALAVFVSAAATPLKAAEPDVLKLVPPDAQVVVMIPSLSALSDDIAKIATSLNLPQQELQQPLGLVKAMLGIQNGLDESGGVALVMPTIQLGGEPQLMAFIPVTDYKAFVANFGGVAGDGVTNLTLNGQTGFVKPSGKYAVFSNAQPMVDAYQPPSKPGLGAAGALGSAVLGGGDVVVYVNFGAIGPMFQPLVAAQMEQLKAQMAAVPQGASLGWVFDMYGGIAQAVLRDGQSVTLGLDVSPEGFGLHFAAQFKENSALGKMFADAPGKELAFDRLPDKPYFFATSFNTKALPIDQWMADFAAMMPADFPMAKVIQSSLDIMKLAGENVQSAMYTPNLAGGGGLFNTVTVYSTSDPDKFIAENRKLLASLNELDLGQGMTIRTQYEEGAVQVEGVKRVDRYRSKTDMPPDLLAQAGPLGGLLAQEQIGYVIPVKGAVVMAAGQDPSTLKATVDAANGGGTMADKGIKALRPKLLGNRAAEGYVGVGAIVQFANGFLGLMAPQFVVDVPENLSPIASGLSVGHGGVGGSLYVPMDIVVAGKKYVDKIQGGGAGSGSPGASSSTAPSSSPLVVSVTDANFETEVLGSATPVLVDFYAVWSGNSKAQVPVIDDLARQYKGRLKVCRLDVDENTQTTDLYEVDSYPTVLIFKDGVKTAGFPGLTSREKLDAAIRQTIQ